jgi:hypothetical protein
LDEWVITDEPEPFAGELSRDGDMGKDRRTIAEIEHGSGHELTVSLTPNTGSPNSPLSRALLVHPRSHPFMLLIDNPRGGGSHHNDGASS